MSCEPEALPEPLVPSDCDLTSFDWFRLYHRRLKQSEWWLSASDFARSRNVDLWCEAADQVPAASVPNNDIVLARFAGFGRDIAGFRAAKDELMDPWVLCSDGRWYHPTLAEAALEGFGFQKEHNERRKAARERKRKRREELKPDRPQDIEALSRDCPRDNDHLSQGQSEMSEGQAADVHGMSRGKPCDIALRGGEGRREEESVASAMPSATEKARSRRSPSRSWTEDQVFAEAWSGCSDQMRRRSKSREMIYPIWLAQAELLIERFPSLGPDPDGRCLASALARYWAEDADYARTGGPGLQTWLTDGKWEHWLPVQADPNAEIDDDTWEIGMAMWRESGGKRWPASLGPRPGEPGCRAPNRFIIRAASAATAEGAAA